MLRFHVITLFPEAIRSYFESSIIGRAQKAGKIKVSFYNPKEYTRDRRDRVDRRPYGGGPGMVLEPNAVLRAVSAAVGKKKAEIIFFSTAGKVFDEARAQKLSKKKDIILVCGHYEGVDERVVTILKAKKISVGPYVVTGGELPSAIVVDAVSRFVKGVLGKEESLEGSRVSSPEVYTRPEVFVWKNKSYKVPKILLSGHHAKINEWKTAKRMK
ncbi:MAG TPA: tRNA (guanosine(37)-N1)-methyltransferase TrmD [Candidatus Paceibacterota bacterium]